MVAIILALLLISAPAYAQTMIRAEVSATVVNVVTISQNDDGTITMPPDVTCTATGNLFQCDY